MKKLLIFDYDGVIVDSLVIFRKNLIEACARRASVDISEKDFLELFDGNMYEGMARLGVLEDKIPQILEDLKEGLSKEQGNLKLFDGIDEVARRLSKQNYSAIITSNVSSVVENYLTSRGMNCFTEVLGADKGTSKVQKIGILKSRYPGFMCYYVGDTLGDMIEGKAAGVITIAVTWGWHNEERLLKGKPDYIVNKPLELVNLFKET